MIGYRLQVLRESIGKTQVQVAKDLNLTQSSYSLYEKDKRSPDFTTLKKIADYFHVSMAYILGETDDPKQLSKNTNTADTPDTFHYHKAKDYKELDEIGQFMVDEFIDFVKIKYTKK